MLKRIPNENDMARMSFELAALGARCAGELLKWPYTIANKYELLALAAEMSRYDPRLFGILVEFFCNNWREINPLELRTAYSAMETPQIFGVIGEFFKKAVKDNEAIHYYNYLTGGLKPLPTQFFFHSLYQVGGPLAGRAAEASLTEYKRWGFLAAERPTIDAASKMTIGTLDANSRLNILRRLLTRKKVIQISDYLNALGNDISRQQALSDLQKCKFATKIGRGRGSKWKLAA